MRDVEKQGLPHPKDVRDIEAYLKDIELHRNPRALKKCLLA
jgi:hypothetical protein